MSDAVIATAAEAEEAQVFPRLREVRADASKCPTERDLPPALQGSVKDKSPARWAYERLIHYIKRFEESLDANQELAMAMTGGHSGVLRIEGLGYFDPDIVTFYGVDASGSKTQLIQHVSQLSVILRALPHQTTEDDPPYRIGFRLARELDAETESENETPATDVPDAAPGES